MENEKFTILVVEDQKINRDILSNLLNPEYDVIEAENGSDAVEKLEHCPEITAILLDLVMPVMDGYQFLEYFKDSDFSALPLIAVTGDKDDETERRVLELGAWDFISKPYQPATLLTRLKNVIIRSQYYLISRMKYVYEHDPLTGLYNRSTFFSEAGKLMTNHPEIKFAMVRVDIDHFQTYNSFWGEEEGDKLLRSIANQLRLVSERYPPCIYGRINADAFCICMPDLKDEIGMIAHNAFDELAVYNKKYRLVPSFGVYEVEEPWDKPQKMYELAKLASTECKGSFIDYLAYYRPEISRRLLENQWVINEMQHALDSNQFEVYLQPKYDINRGYPSGSEALIRWNHPTRGILSPAMFIPVFEQNGFICKVDCFVWETVCRLLHDWIARGIDPLPVSVNVSRVNMYNPHIVRIIQNLVEKYSIPPKLLELEVTESAYMTDPEIMASVVSELQSRGFVILMDDFGSGYSSLNTLKDVSVDVLKIDMKFLSDTSDRNRSRKILESTVKLALELETPVIMEGVETEEQVNFLKKIGCNYVQGFFYARPMPVPKFEKLVFA